VNTIAKPSKMRVAAIGNIDAMVEKDFGGIVGGPAEWRV